MNNVKRQALVTGLSVVAALTSCAGAWAQKQNTVERMYVLYCGEGTAPDQSRWSPGVNVGKPITLSNSCYLVKHGKDWLLWDTGYNDDYAGKPDGTKSGDSVVFRKESLAAELAAMGWTTGTDRYEPLLAPAIGGQPSWV